MRSALIGLTLVSMGGLLGGAAQDALGAQFSATMLQSGPDNEQSSGRIYVQDSKTRTEMGEGAEQRVTIIDTGTGEALMLNPSKREYVEMPRPQQAPSGRPALPGEPGSPCGKVEGLSCQQLGTEQIAGRRTEKWEIVMSRGQQSMRSVVWVDRGLGMPVREELPGGYVRELRDIRTGAQPASLFEIPAGYRRIEMPPPQGQGDSRQR